MRPSMRLSRKKKVKTPGGTYKLHKYPKAKAKASCGVTGKSLLGSRRNRAFPDVSSSISRELLRNKVKIYAKKE